jgi:hypothetical protein
MAQQLLNCSDIVSILKQVGRKAVSQRVTTSRFRNARGLYRAFDRSLQCVLSDVVSAYLA